jgi:hypothetical protein
VSDPPAKLTVLELETVYDWLANAIDQAGRTKAELFLVKLALLDAQALCDPGRTQQHITTALKDL